MKKDIPILVIGMGSIGLRRYQNLKTLGYTNVHVYDIDSKKTREYKSLPKLTEKAIKDFSVVIVATPTTLHIKNALLGARAGAALFIEKPLSYDTQSISLLLAEAKKKGTYASVACNFRFHQGFTKLEALLKRDTLGKPRAARVIFTRDITRGVSDASYRKSYAASAKGGGVIFDLGPHVFEYLETLFGKMTAVTAKSTSPARLGISAEEFVSGVLEHKSGMVSVFQLDYFTQPKRHEIEVLCEKGTVTLDIARNTLRTSIDGKVKEEVFDSKERDHMYEREMAHFMNSLNKNSAPTYSLSRGRSVVSVCETVRNSGRIGQRLTIKAT